MTFFNFNFINPVNPAGSIGFWVIRHSYFTTESKGIAGLASWPVPGFSGRINQAGPGLTTLERTENWKEREKFFGRLNKLCSRKANHVSCGLSRGEDKSIGTKKKKKKHTQSNMLQSKTLFSFLALPCHFTNIVFDLGFDLCISVTCIN